MFNLKYIFEIFVVGNNNRFVYVVVLVVVEILLGERIYNLFFIYGGVGFGKMYFMYVIGYYVLKFYFGIKVMYVMLEIFINELIVVIRDEKINEFRFKYRNVDVFLIDDI